MIIDAHQHFWKYDAVRDSWINGDMKIIRRDFMPADLQPVLQQNGIDGCVLVQSDQTEKENVFQLKNAEESHFIKGVVGWVDFQSKDIEDRLAYYSSFPVMKGFRHILQGEQQRDLMLGHKFMNGISRLNNFGFTYDILIFPDQLKYIPTFVSCFPDQKFVIDHIAKPAVRNGEIDDWKKDIERVAGSPNVYCKVSGMVTEADWKGWKREDFTPYLDVVVNAFGTNRIMFGSDWPVCLLAGNYERILSVVKDYFSSFSANEREMFFGMNAVKFYNL